MESAITYDDSAKVAAPTSYWYIHKVSDVITGLINSGMVISRFEEHAHSNRETSYEIYENQEPQLPMSFTLIASRSE